jgi:hypothetical protein
MQKYEETDEREINWLKHGLILSWQPDPEGMEGGTKID